MSTDAQDAVWPSNWTVLTNDGTTLTATNTLSGQSFSGTPQQFYALFTSQAVAAAYAEVAGSAAFGPYVDSTALQTDKPAASQVAGAQALVGASAPYAVFAVVSGAWVATGVSGGPVASTSITDSTSAGRALLTAADDAAQRTALALQNVDNTSDANKPISSAAQTALNAKADLSGGKLATSQLPSLSVVAYLGTVANQAAMLALAGQQGDWCIRTDLSTTWIITGADPTLLAGWTQLSYPTAPVTSVAGRTGAVTLSATDISGLGTAATTASSAYATAAQGAKADTAVQIAGALGGTPDSPTVPGLDAKQATLIAGTNIKTINGQSPLGASNLTTFGVPLSQLTIDYGVRRIRAALRKMRAADILPAPVPVAPYKHTGTAVYCNPAVGGPGTGTLADPYQSIVTALAAITTAGQGLYVLYGSTVNITAALSVPVSGTASAPIVIGVYYAGGRICTGKRGAVTIDCGGNAIDAITVDSRNYVCIEGFKIQNNGTANSGVTVSGTSSNCQVLNCDIVTSGNGINVNCSAGGHVVQGNRSSNAAYTGILIRPTTTDSTTTVQYNVVTGAVNRSIFVYNDYSNTIKFSGTIAHNIVMESPSVAADASGVTLVTAGGAPKIYGNVVSKCNIGISIVSAIDFVTKQADFSGMLIQNNDLRNNEFGIAANGVIGTWVMEHNYIADSGTWNGTTKITTAGYGRGIELWGLTAVTASGGGTIRFNFITRSRNWATGIDTNGGEGIGIGLDDNTFGVTVYGNFLVQNEGSGIQLNTANGNRIISNICYDNCALPGGSPRVIINGLAAEIVSALSFDTLIANNTLVSTGRTYQRNGISTWIYDGPGSRVHNNLCIGQTVAGMSMTAGYVESHNRVVGAPSLVVTETEAARTAGTGTAPTTSAAALVPDDLFFSILPGGSCDGTGVDLGEALVDFDGQLSGGTRNIGATLLLSDTR